MINPFGLFVSVALFKGAQIFNSFIEKKGFKIPIPPILIAGIILILILKFGNIDFDTYNESGSFLTLMLIPAVIALGYPIYKHKDLLIKNKRIIYPGFVFATVFALLSTFFVAKFAHTNLKIIISMLPKSVTAPIAVEISKGIGGLPELTACVAVLTGVFGAVFGHKLLKIFKVKNDIAIGLSIGAASHVIGTARCAEKGRELQVVMASLALVIVGILTAIVAPLFVLMAG